MRIIVDKIPDKGLSLEFDEKPKNFPVLTEIEASGECAFIEPIRSRLEATRVRDIVSVRGVVETRIRISCARCLETYEFPVHRTLDLYFTPREPEPEGRTPKEGIEIREEMIGMVPFEGDHIELDEVIQEQVVLSIPARPLCRPDCKGICPRCGAELNHESCGCDTHRYNEQFAALKNRKWN